MSFKMYLKFSGGKASITGDSGDDDHKSEIAIVSWGWGVTNKADLHTSAKTPQGKSPQAGDIQIMKHIDSASTAILNACTYGLHAQEAFIYVANGIDFLTVHLSNNVAITSVSHGANIGADKIGEELWLHFGKIDYKFQPQKKDLTADGGAKTYTFDIPAGGKVKTD